MTTSKKEMGNNIMEFFLYANNRVIHIPASEEIYLLTELVDNVPDDYQGFSIKSDVTQLMLLLNGEEYAKLSDYGSELRLGTYEFVAIELQRQIFWVKTTLDLWIANEPGAMIRLAGMNEPVKAGGGLFLQRETEQENWSASIQDDAIFSEGQRLLAGQQIQVFDGQEFYVGTNRIKVFTDEVWIWATPQELGTNLPFAQIKSSHDRDDGFPSFRRSPRLILRAPDDQISIPTPPDKEKDNGQGVLELILPPALSLLATAAMAIFMHRGIYVLITGAVTVVTTVTSVNKYFKDKKNRSLDAQLSQQAFREQIADKNIELTQANAQQRHAKNFHYPDIATMAKMVETVDSRLYEKTPQHFDFLTYRLGLGDEESSSDVKFEAKAETAATELGKLAQTVYDNGRVLHDMPIVGTLNTSVVGYVGQRQTVLEQLQLLVMQIATFHSYHDLEFVTIFPEEEKQVWDWMKWLPHNQLHDINVRGFVYNQRTRDQVMGSIYSMLKDRKNALAEANRNQQPIFLPHLIIMVTDEKLIMDHVIMEFLQENPRELGVSLIFTADVRSQLRENVQTVIDMRDANTGVLVMEDGVVKDTEFKLDHVSNNVDKEAFARRLSVLDHQLSMKSSIPETLDFMQMYDVKTVDELNIQQRWDQNQPRKSMAVPIGWRADHDIVELNLHEKADGPHGLLAGTTGSGKTEVVKDLITSLAVNFKPTDVAFLPIDFKGGALANDLKPLPHTVGAITNLDASSAMRALSSINAEMKRRQKLFTDAGVSNINDYHKLIESGEVTIPMPHLVMISDEFAELKSQMPDFLDELVSIARVGRSLGVHLILATQKPAGVVNDQIWANSKFKIALKVADAADSKEILKTPDAADITQTGRGYLQVGNNERYELFQTAYSGAKYDPEAGDQQDQDIILYEVNELGQYQQLNQGDSSAEVENQGLAQTQMDAIVAKINEIFDANGYGRPAQVWLPALTDKIYADDILQRNYVEIWQEGNALPNTEVTIGMMDLPAKQAQEPLTIDFSDDGHLAIFSSPTYGKTTILQMISLELMRQNRPDQTQLHYLDFGLSGLIAFKDAAHTQNYLTMDDTEAINAWFEDMQSEIARRKQLLSEQKVANVVDYRTKTNQDITEMYVFVDAYENSQSEKFRSNLEEMLVMIARQGVALGIHLVITAGKSSFIRANILANIRRRIMLTINEQGEASAILGRTRLIPQDRPGAGLVKFEDDIVQFQAFYPIRTEEDSKVNMLIMDDIEQFNKAWDEMKPENWGVPALDPNSEEALMAELGRELENGELLLGRNAENTEVIETIKLPQDGIQVIMTQSDDQTKWWYDRVNDALGLDNTVHIDFMTNGIGAVNIRNQFVLPAISGNLPERFSGRPVVISRISDLLELYEEAGASRAVAGLDTNEMDDDGDLEIDKLFALPMNFILIDTERNLTTGRERDVTETIRDGIQTFIYVGNSGERQSFARLDKYKGNGTVLIGDEQVDVQLMEEL